MTKSNQKTWKLIKSERGFYLQIKIKRSTILILPLEKSEGEFIKRKESDETL